MKIKISYNTISLEADIFDTQTGKAIFEHLPFSGEAQVWGEEAYFTTNISQPLEDNAQNEVPVGGLAYWPSGKCFCIFWGQTPVSAVNIFGQITGNISKLKELNQGDKLVITKI